jgi:hypothetical protein
MTSRIKDRLKLWNFPRDIWRQVAAVKDKDLPPPYGSDRPESCVFGTDYWNNYPVNDYRYTYNSWGLRSHLNYEDLYGREVVMCIGDSATVNIGGPMEHSWPFFLSEKFDIPVLNFGIDALCYYHYADLVTKAREFFKVQHVFVLYNLLERSDRIGNALKPVAIDIDAKITSLKKHFWVQGSTPAFVPPWGFHPEELRILYQHFPGCHDYFKLVKFDYTTIDPILIIKNPGLQEKYLMFAGHQWPDFQTWATQVVSGIDPYLGHTSIRDRRLIYQLLDQFVNPYVLRNRDGFHMSRVLNQALADYFYQNTRT